MPYYRFYILIFILQLIRPLEGQSYLPPELLPIANGLVVAGSYLPAIRQ